MPRIFWSSPESELLGIYVDIWLEKSECEWLTDRVIIPDNPIIYGYMGCVVRDSSVDGPKRGLNLSLFPAGEQIRLSSAVRFADRLVVLFELLRGLSKDGVIEAMVQPRDVDLSHLFRVTHEKD